MTETESNIQTFEKLIPEIEDYMDVYAYEKAALQAALQALREKAENDKLQEEGRLVVLPCAENGADLFFVDLYRREIYKEAYTNGIALHWTNHNDLGDTIPLSIIGKTVFLTREEAEKALEG